MLASCGRPVEDTCLHTMHEVEREAVAQLPHELELVEHRLARHGLPGSAGRSEREQGIRDRNLTDDHRNCLARGSRNSDPYLI